MGSLSSSLPSAFYCHQYLSTSTLLQDDHHLPPPGAHDHRAAALSSLMLTITSLFHHDHHLDGVVHRGRVDPQLHILSTFSALNRLNSAIQSQPHLLPAILAPLRLV